MTDVYHSPNVKAEYDCKLAENTEHASLLNVETILLEEMNLDWPPEKF